MKQISTAVMSDDVQIKARSSDIVEVDLSC